MKNYIFTLTCFFIVTYVYTQEYYYTTAKSGLNVRETPNLKSKKIAKIPFGVVVAQIENTHKELIVKDEGKELKGSWIKIKIYNYPYITSNDTSGQNTKEGFVFSGFLKPMTRENLKVVIKSMTKSKFLNLKKELSLEIQGAKKIKDLDSIKSLLKDRVTWQKWSEDSEDEEEIVVKSIITENKQKLVFDTHNSDTGFAKGYSGYFPDEQILLLEGGHSSDVSFSIIYGGETATVGNPQYIEDSEKTNYRLNGYFGGQECVFYFLEKKENGVFKFYSNLNLFRDHDICYFKEFYWIGKTQFIYSKNSYDEEGRNEFEEYFTGEIRE